MPKTFQTFQRLMGLPNNNPGTVLISDDDNIHVILSTLHFLRSRVSFDENMHFLLLDFWEYLGKDKTSAWDLMVAWMDELPSFLAQHQDNPFYATLNNEIKTHGSLRGLGPNDTTYACGSSGDPHNILDEALVHLDFRVGEDWYSLITIETGEDDEVQFPIACKVPDPTRLFENENAIVTPEKLEQPRWEFHQGNWFSLSRRDNDLPLSEYPISRDAKDCGRGKIYWNGSTAFCPITGRPLTARSLGT